MPSTCWYLLRVCGRGMFDRGAPLGACCYNVLPGVLACELQVAELQGRFIPRFSLEVQLPFSVFGGIFVHTCRNVLLFSSRSWLDRYEDKRTHFFAFVALPGPETPVERGNGRCGHPPTLGASKAWRARQHVEKAGFAVGEEPSRHRHHAGYEVKSTALSMHHAPKQQQRRRGHAPKQQ